MSDEEELIQAGEITTGEMTLDNIDAGHISIGILSAKTGKQGVMHLYSDSYRERWPQDQYPELYEEDVPVD